MKPLQRLLVTMAIAGVMVGLAALFRAEHPRLLARHWQGQLETVPDDQARSLLGRIGELGEPGIPVLVEALGSQRESVARAARKVLMERLDVWTRLPAREVTPKLLILADALAEHAPRFGPTARQDAEDLATWLLRWRPPGAARDRARLIASCGKVLEAAGPDRVGPPEERTNEGPDYAGGGRPGEPTLEGVPDALRSDRTSPSEHLFADLARMPGAGPPLDTDPAAVLPPERPGGSGRSDAGGAEPRAMGNSAVVRLPPPRDSDRFEGATGPTAPYAAEAAVPVSLDRSGRQPSDTAEDLTGVETLELMRRLRRSGGDATARIRAELVRRGFSEVHLELAGRLFDPDPEVRADLARRLPGLQSVDAAPWLLWLSEDQDAEVRLVAITLLATTGDPSLLRRVEQKAARDPDPRIRRQAQRIAQRPGGARK